MDADIAYVAKHGCVDAAHYTWVKLVVPEVLGRDEDDLNDLLIQHGDYTSYLPTNQLRLPFENIAVVWVMPPSQGFGKIEVSLLTVDCENSMPRYVNMWFDGLDGKSFINLVRVHLKPTPQDRMRITRQKHYGLTDQTSPENSPDQHALVEVLQALPDKLRDEAVNLAITLTRKGLRYIACASAGLLADPDFTYHTATGHPSNAKRIRKGKVPLYEWRTVELQRKPAELPSAPNGGTHASPRLHQRRGHWATSKLGKKFWRRETVVGNPENGVIMHDYKDGESNARHEV